MRARLAEHWQGFTRGAIRAIPAAVYAAVVIERNARRCRAAGYRDGYRAGAYETRCLFLERNWPPPGFDGPDKFDRDRLRAAEAERDQLARHVDNLTAEVTRLMDKLTGRPND